MERQGHESMTDPATLRVKLLREGAITPSRATDGSAGFDLHAWLEPEHSSISLWKGRTAHIKTGIAVEIPRGFVGLVCPRSGLAKKYGMTVVNAPGVIDSDFRGELEVLLFRTAAGTDEQHVATISHGDRIAQLVIVPCAVADITVVDELSVSSRGAGGFGSTGR